MRAACGCNGQRQLGSALIVGLIILLVLTVMGVTGMGIMTTEQRMASGYQKMDLSFQMGQNAINKTVQAGRHPDSSLDKALGVGCPVDGVATGFNSPPVTASLEGHNAGLTSEVNLNTAFWGGNASPRSLPGFEFGGDSGYVGMEYEITADSSVLVGGVVSANSVQVQSVTVVGKAGQSDCKYVPPEQRNS